MVCLVLARVFVFALGGWGAGGGGLGCRRGVFRVSAGFLLAWVFRTERTRASRRRGPEIDELDVLFWFAPIVARVVERVVEQRSVQHLQGQLRADEAVGGCRVSGPVASVLLVLLAQPLVVLKAKLPEHPLMADEEARLADVFVVTLLG